LIYFRQQDWKGKREKLSAYFLLRYQRKKEKKEEEEAVNLGVS